MKIYVATLVMILGGWCGSVMAQPTLQHPDQFYSNGTNNDAWTRNEQAGLFSTFWFARNPQDTLSYKQQIVIVYDVEPEMAYYFDSTTKKFIGRFDLETDEYSLLPLDARKSRLEDIDRGQFPSAGEMPSIGEMLAEAQPGVIGNPDQMMMPPPTMKFPRLNKSSWDSNYITNDGSRVRATVTFDGNRGTYQIVDQSTVGKLSDVEYEMRENDFRITGSWSLGGSVGRFRFLIPSDNMDVFWGDWGVRSGHVNGTWDGIRNAR